MLRLDEIYEHDRAEVLIHQRSRGYLGIGIQPERGCIDPASRTARIDIHIYIPFSLAWYGAAGAPVVGRTNPGRIESGDKTRRQKFAGRLTGDVQPSGAD